MPQTRRLAWWQDPAQTAPCCRCRRARRQGQQACRVTMRLKNRPSKQRSQAASAKQSNPVLGTPAQRLDYQVRHVRSRDAAAHSGVFRQHTAARCRFALQAAGPHNDKSELVTHLLRGMATAGFEQDSSSRGHTVRCTCCRLARVRQVHAPTFLHAPHLEPILRLLLLHQHRLQHLVHVRPRGALAVACRQKQQRRGRPCNGLCATLQHGNKGMQRRGLPAGMASMRAPSAHPCRCLSQA